jgi:hypothetical protein
MKTPIDERERAICTRLAQLRSAVTGGDKGQFGDLLGWGKAKVEEHEAASFFPLTFGDFCQLFLKLSCHPVWLATGEGNQSMTASGWEWIRSALPAEMLFSEAFDSHLAPAFAGHAADPANSLPALFVACELAKRDAFTGQASEEQIAALRAALAPWLPIGVEHVLDDDEHDPTIYEADAWLPGEAPSAHELAAPSGIDASAVSKAVAELFQVSADVLTPAVPIFQELIAKAEATNVSLVELIDAAERVLALLPEIAGQTDVMRVATAMADGMGTAATRLPNLSTPITSTQPN